jgi:uncharacterized Zn-finger protein
VRLNCEQSSHVTVASSHDKPYFFGYQIEAENAPAHRPSRRQAPSSCPNYTRRNVKNPIIVQEKWENNRQRTYITPIADLRQTRKDGARRNSAQESAVCGRSELVSRPGLPHFIFHQPSRSPAPRPNIMTAPHHSHLPSVPSQSSSSLPSTTSYLLTSLPKRQFPQDISDIDHSPSPGQDTPSVANKKKHVCHLCSKAFTTSGHLSRHTRIHTGERNHKCPFPGCDTRCSRQDNLQQQCVLFPIF